MYQNLKLVFPIFTHLTLLQGYMSLVFIVFDILVYFGNL